MAPTMLAPKLGRLLARSLSPDAFALTPDLLCEVAELDAGAPAGESPSWQELREYGLEDFAWRQLGTQLMREMRKRSFSGAIDHHFKSGSNRNQRDTIAVRRTVSGLLKLL